VATCALTDFLNPTVRLYPYGLYIDKLRESRLLVSSTPVLIRDPGIQFILITRSFKLRYFQINELYYVKYDIVDLNLQYVSIIIMIIMIYHYHDYNDLYS
jgi:hypothetical protein